MTSPKSISTRPQRDYEMRFHEVLQLIYLTISAFGLQIVWSTEMGQASPYLLSLGLNKSGMAIVFLAGPLSGLIMQPLVGIYADRCKHPLGRRRPFIILGSLTTILSILVFVWAREIVNLVLTSQSDLQESFSIWLAALAFYVMDFSLNVVTVAARCLVVDTLPSDQQARGNAYFSRISGLGSLVIYSMSDLDLPSLFHTSLSQLKLISLSVILVFAGTQSITCYMVPETRTPTSTIPLRRDSDTSPSLSQAFVGLYQTWTGLGNSLIKPICWIQFWSSIGWFPILFYSSTWVGEIWSRWQADPEVDHQQATRMGNKALMVQSLVSFLTTLLLPFLFARRGSRSSWVGADGHRVALARLWCLSQGSLCLLMWLSWICEKSPARAVGLIGLTGISWGVTIWVPHTLLAEEILTKPSKSLLSLSQSTPLRELKPYSLLQHAPNPLTPITEESTPTSSTMPSPPIDTHESDPDEEITSLLNQTEGLDSSHRVDPTLTHPAGTILGIQNVFVVIPQFLVSFLASFVFWMVEIDGEEGPEGITIVFCVGGLASGIAMYLCWDLSQQMKIKNRFV